MITNSLGQRALRALIVALLAASGFQSIAFAQGSLTPPAAPGPIFKTLAQIEPRTAITNTGAVTISGPGSYYLTTNITVSVSNAVTIAANNVTLDLNGFTISSTALAPAGTAILIANSPTNITIFNGIISSGVKETGGVFSGTGFDSGIAFAIDANNTNTYGQPVNVRVTGVTVSGCLSYGIFLGGFSTVVDSCAVQTAGAYGVWASIIRNSIATDCGDVAISGSTIVSDCYGQCIGNSWGVYAGTTAQNCYGESNGSDGVHAQQMALNCYGTTASSGSYGLYTDNAQNCYGYNSIGTGMRATSAAINCHAYGGTTGLAADANAENCYGRCNTNGVALIAGNAVNCYGYCPAGSSGIGLSAGRAINCSGQDDGDGIGLSAGVAFCCSGVCYGNNYGISATILNTCTYYRATGTPGYSGTKYNMP
jgi:hypothetical protein